MVAPVVALFSFWFYSDLSFFHFFNNEARDAVSNLNFKLYLKPFMTCLNSLF